MPDLTDPTAGLLFQEALPSWLQGLDYVVYLTALGWFFAGFLAVELRYRAKRSLLSFPAWGEVAFVCYVLCIRSVVQLLMIGPQTAGLGGWAQPLVQMLAVVALAPLIFRLIREKYHLLGGVCLLTILILILPGQFGASRVWSDSFWAESSLSWWMFVFYVFPYLLAWGTLAGLVWMDVKTRPLPFQKKGRKMMPWLELAMLLLFILAGYLLLGITQIQAESVQRESLLSKARIAALSLPHQEILALKRSIKPTGDDNAPQLAVIRDSLNRIRQTDPQVLRAYLWKFLEDRPTLFLSSSPTLNATPEENTVTYSSFAMPPFSANSTEGFVVPPFRIPEFGAVVAGNERIVDPATGRTICWLGLDMPAEAWLTAASEARWKLFGILTAFSAGLVLLRGYRFRFEEASFFEQQKQHLADLERKRLSLEIHNDLGQRLAAISMQAVALKSRLQDTNPSEAEAAGAITRLASEATTEARDIALGLQPELQLQYGLAPALSQITERAKSLLNTRIEMAVSDGLGEISPVCAEAIIRMVQEAITNAVRHGKARDIAITVSSENKNIRLVVWDNGAGFDKQRLHQGGGLGLSYVLQQVRDLGGSLEVDTGPNRGTMLKIELPKDAGRF